MSEVEMTEPLAGGYSVTLPTFEGPLDLLLHLCQKHELDILDIPIAFVTEKYLEYLAVMQLLNLDVASEYLVMAATLAHIKSKMLLPAPPPGQEDEVPVEEEDPREALIRRLLEYQKYKQAGEELTSMGVAQQNVFFRGVPIEEAVHTGLPPLAQVPLFSLVEAFQNVLSKSQVKLSHDIVHERVTLADRINELVDVLRARRRVAFEELFEGLTTRFDLVITFLALLEMTRLRMTRLFQADFDSTIYIEFTAQVTEEQEQLGEGMPEFGKQDDVEGEAGAEPVAENGIDPAAAHGFGDDETTDVRVAFHLAEGAEPLPSLDDVVPNDEATEMRQAFDFEATQIAPDASDVLAHEPADAEDAPTTPREDEIMTEASAGEEGEASAPSTDANGMPTSGAVDAPSNESSDPGAADARDDAGDENT